MLPLLVLGAATGLGESNPEPLSQRLLSSVPGIAMCFALLWPYRTIRRPWLFWVVFSVLTAVSIWWLLMVPDAFAGYRSRAKSWAIIPTSIGIAGLSIANAVALVAVAKRRGHDVPASEKSF
jgi:hypothetical protein